MSIDPDLCGPPSDQAIEQVLTVYYDGDCPLCRKEISYYQRKDRDHQVCWIDANSSKQSYLGVDLTQQQALKRFHVRTADGSLVSGSKAFAAMWEVLPGFQRMGKVAKTEWVSGVLEIVYRLFLLIRPSIQRIYRTLKPAENNGRFG